MSNGASSRICVIGLGSMGLGMAGSLLRAGYSVTGVDLDPKAVAVFAAAGGRVAKDAAEAANEADIVVVVVVTGAQTEVVLFGDSGAAATMRRGGVIVSCATMAPEFAKRLAKQASAQDLLYLDAPMSGGAARAAQGQLTFMASGSPQAFAQARPALEVVAAKVYELGDEAGVGSSFKIVNQLLAGVHIAAACEAMTFAKRMGLDLRKVYEVITASAGNSWMFENRVPHILDGDYAPKSAINIFTKDLGIVSEIGREQTFPLPIAACALQMFLMTAAAGMGRDDDASIARLIARTTGLDLPLRDRAP